jgi:DNA-binding SARP family transcriptional activator
VPVIGIRVLGPLEVTVDGATVGIGGPRQRCVLARLVVARGQVVAADRLIEDLYAGEAPLRALAAVQSYVSHLRRALEPGRTAWVRESVLAASPPGYALRLGHEAVDAWAFEDEVHAAAGLDDPAAVHARLSAALDSWRGTAFQEFAGQPWADLESSRLAEVQLNAIEQRAGAALRLGRAAQLVADLDRLTAEHPLREEAWRLLALALYQSGRQGDALAALRRARARLAEELGVDPGPALRELENGILAQAPRLAAPATAAPHASPAAIPARTTNDLAPGKAEPYADKGAELARATAAAADAADSQRRVGLATGEARPAVPRLLPAAIADFTGREDEAAEIGRHLAGAAGNQARVAAPMVVITGPGGVGKTTLAVQLAHNLAHRFRHGQLFADLHGGGPDPVAPTWVLERFLRALGMSGQLPETLDERAEIYRNLLAGRRALIVLDDASRESQVAPLLPGRGAAVLVTSRARLTGLPGAVHVDLGGFGPDTSLELLTRIVGAERVQAQSAAAAAVAGQCGHLPLALRIAGARLAARPHWDIAQLAERLADETRRLDELRHGDMHVRASITLSHDSAPEKAQRLLRRLALLDAPVFSGWVAAPLLDQPPAEAADLLDELVSAQLVQAAGTGRGVHSQYRLHDLILVYARERLAADEPLTEQRAVLERALGALLYLAKEAEHRNGDDYLSTHIDASRWSLPGPLVEQLVSDPMAFYERERAVLVTGVQQAARAGLTELCWSLAFAAASLFDERSYFDDWQQTHEIALEAARRAGDVRGHATILYALGSLHQRQGQPRLAREELGAAERLYQGAGDDHGLARVALQLALLDQKSGRLEDAARRSQQALPVLRRLGDLKQAVLGLRTLAGVKLELGEPGSATELLTEARRLAQTGPNKWSEAATLHQLSRAYVLAGDPARAIAALETALAIARELGDPSLEANVQVSAGFVSTRLGEFGQAQEALQRAVELASIIGDPVIEARARLGLGELALASGNPSEAVRFAQRVEQDLGAMEAGLYQAQAFALLSQAHAALGDSTSNVQ